MFFVKEYREKRSIFDYLTKQYRIDFYLNNTELKSKFKHLEYWKFKSIDLIREATIEKGIKASCTDRTNYGAIFTRDAVMAGIAGLLYDDEKIIEGLRATIETLYRIRGDQGQIASNYQIIDGEIDHVSFGRLSPKFDSPTWYLLGIAFLNNKGSKYAIDHLEKTVDILSALEYNGQHLIYVPQGGNWADEYPFEGYILYDQILRCWALQILSENYERADWGQKSRAILSRVRTAYFDKNAPHYYASFSPSDVNQYFDLAAHSLFGMIDNTKENQHLDKSFNWIKDKFLIKGKLPPVFYPVIQEEDERYSKVRQFHLFEFRNKPFHFHNGGIWFIWLGWLALAMKKNEKKEELDMLAHITDQLLEQNSNFDFHEYFTSNTLQPEGTKKLCYTATGILFINYALENGSSILD